MRMRFSFSLVKITWADAYSSPVSQRKTVYLMNQRIMNRHLSRIGICHRRISVRTVNHQRLSQLSFIQFLFELSEPLIIPPVKTHLDQMSSRWRFLPPRFFYSLLPLSPVVFHKRSSFRPLSLLARPPRGYIPAKPQPQLPPWDLLSAAHCPYMLFRRKGRRLFSALFF